MPNPHSRVGARASATAFAVKAFFRQFLIPLLLSALDSVALIGFGRDAYQLLSAFPSGREIFVLLVAEMIGTLVHVWFLTFRNQKARSNNESLNFRLTIKGETHGEQPRNNVSQRSL